MGRGVWKYNNTNIRTFTDLDGFNPDDWQESTGVFDSNENLWLGSATGLYKIRNEKILDFYN